MNENVNILTDQLKPHTFGEMIDALIIMNIRMWHAQELFFDLDKLTTLPHDQIVPLLTYTTRLNLLRNQAMDGIDAALTLQLKKRFPSLEISPDSNPSTPSTIIWEPS